MKLSAIRKEDIDKNNRDLVHRVLFNGIQDDGKNGDLIFVFGSRTATKYRVPLAVTLYKAGRAKKIIMSGGNQEPPEAVMMRDAAIELGVPAEDIGIEENSAHTIANVIYSKHVLEKEICLNKVKRILIVTTLYHMRRCLLTMKTYLPEHIEYTLCPANDRISRMDNWWMSDKGTQRVLQEIERLVYYTKNGKIIDAEI